jgi:hypothetical protein
MKINDLKKYDKTVKKISWDDANNEYLSEIEEKACDFDAVKMDYCKELLLDYYFKSNDMLFINENEELYFVEFKNGQLDRNKLAEIEYKIYDSLLIILDILDKTLRFSRDKIHYALVYNSEKNTNEMFLANGLRGKRDITSSPAMITLTNTLNAKANQKYRALFGLEKFVGGYFKKVYTVDKIDCDIFLKEKVLSI